MFNVRRGDKARIVQQTLKNKTIKTVYVCSFIFGEVQIKVLNCFLRVFRMLFEYGINPCTYEWNFIFCFVWCYRNSEKNLLGDFWMLWWNIKRLSILRNCGGLNLWIDDENVNLAVIQIGVSGITFFRVWNLRIQPIFKFNRVF